MPAAPERSAGKPADRSEEAAALLAGAERPAIMAGTGLYWARGEEELQALAEALGIPVFLNGMGRGCVPADHELCFCRARGKGLKEADVALVVGVPLDFRLAFGGCFGEETKIDLARRRRVRADRDPPARPGAGRRHPGDPGGAPRGGRVRRRRPRPHRRLALRPPRARAREARGRAGGAQRRPRPAPPRPRLQGAQPSTRPRRDRDRRRRRLRLIRRPLHQHL